MKLMNIGHWKKTEDLDDWFRSTTSWEENWIGKELKHDHSHNCVGMIWSFINWNFYANDNEDEEKENVNWLNRCLNKTFLYFSSLNSFSFSSLWKRIGSIFSDEKISLLFNDWCSLWTHGFISMKSISSQLSSSFATIELIKMKWFIVLFLHQISFERLDAKEFS